MSAKKPYKKVSERHTVPIYCNQCVAGPDLMKVEVEDGVATRIQSNFDIKGEHPGGGRVCVKAYGLIQKTYNPHRIKQPMKRTNPLKGKEHDPGFEPISWDEALDLVAEKLRGIREKGELDESGYPRLAFTSGGGGTPVQYMGTFPAFMGAWGKLDQGFGSGQGLKCFHSEHLYGELWHRAFTVGTDTPRMKYVIACGHNMEASGGVAGIWRSANARVENNMKRVQVEPHLSYSAAVSAEWVPIKPKTDAAFLYAVMHHILFGLDWRASCDLDFLRDMTTSPYLVGPNGYFLRDAETRKPLMIDSDGKAKPFDSEFRHPTLDGSHQVSAIEVGADGQCWEHTDIEARTSFQCLLDHMAQYTPDWAEKECEVPADTIRRIAAEYVENACVGETTEIDGVTLPLRPVGVMLGRGVNNGWGGYHCCWARTMLLSLVGALEVPGGNIGSMVKLNRPANSRHLSVVSSEDGIMDYPFNPTTKEDWESQPAIRNAFNTLVPLVGSGPWSAALGPAHLPWLFQKDQPKDMPRITKPDVWICYRSNPAISSLDIGEVTERIAEFPFTVAFAYVLDETNYMADVLLPDATDLESLQLMRIGSSKPVDQFWKSAGWAIRQPAGDPVVDARDMTWVTTELAKRIGLLEEYNTAINKGAAGCRLQTEEFDYSLDVTKDHSVEEIWDAVARAASHGTTKGEEVHGIDWFREHGYLLRDYPELQWFLYPTLKERGIRFEMPYQERILRHGTQLANRLHESGIQWWDAQLQEYQPLPHYESFADIWINHTAEVGKNPDDYPFWVLSSKSMQYLSSSNAWIPIINDVAQSMIGSKGVIMNRTRALEMGISEGDEILIESATGQTRGFAELREGIRPDTLLMLGQFDFWITPVAKDLKLPSLNTLSSISLSLTDNTGSSADLARVKITRLSKGTTGGAA